MITKKNITPLLPRWKDAEILIKDGQSVLLQAPRFSCKRQFLSTLGQAVQSNGDVIHLTSGSVAPLRLFSFGALWQTVCDQLGFKARPIAENPRTFEVAFRGMLQKRDNRLYVTLAGCGRGNVTRHHELIGIFNNLLMEDAINQRNQRNMLCVIAIDDFSLSHYLSKRETESDVAYFEKLPVGNLTSEEMESVVESAMSSYTADAEVRKQISTTIRQLTGGHVGLACELVELAVKCAHGGDNPETLGKVIEKSVHSSSILEGLSAALRRDPESLSKTALEYVVPRGAEDSIRIQTLRELGILIRDRPSSKLMLCPGVITDLVKEVAQGPFSPLGRLGSVAAEIGPRIFEGGNVTIDDDDFVVVCISDLHVSEDQYGFEMPDPAGSIKTGRASLGQLLIEDIQKLELLDRVDLLVIAGDIAGNGKADEYDSAEFLIRELMTKLKLDTTKILIVPGNHDMDWDPGKLAVLEPNRPVSASGFNRLLRFLQKETKEDIDVVTVPSRSGVNALTIIGFDSNAVEGPSAGGIGYVPTAALETAQRKLQSSGNQWKKEYLWLVVHHHVFAASNAGQQDAGKRKVSVLANSAEVQSRAVQWSAELIIHGHEHQPSVTVARKWPVDGASAFAPLIVLGAGSVSAERGLLGEFSRNQYFVVYRRREDVIIRSRCMGDQGTSFEPHDDLIIPVTGRHARGAPIRDHSS
jgi:predicted phosphodiesterase